MSGGIYGLEGMGLLEKSFQFLRHLLLIELQGFLIVSNLSILIEFGTDILDLVTGSRQRDVARWTNVGGPIPVGVNRIRRIADSPPDPDAEGRDELDGEEVEVPHLVGHQSSTSSSQPLANRFPSHIIPSAPQTFQPTLPAIPTSLLAASPSPPNSSPAFNQAVRQSPIQKPRSSPITIFQHLQPMASSSRRRDVFSPLPFPAAQVFQRRAH
ncbi:hypothetical protein O181_031616 [Austropuccinia psidii MF-1]|uniref:Uncharacterized protein n=1 Tax=Austropuccinia psidii MF-1 TaxID=1389203 RepID=A0A9Q3D0U1_9BASI|nr:hypothetical protein [Austropuccinia psidii MF-1]